MPKIFPRIKLHLITLLALSFSTNASVVLLDIDFENNDLGEYTDFSGFTGPQSSPNTNLVSRNFGSQVVTPNPQASGKSLQLLPTGRAISGNLDYSQVRAFSSVNAPENIEVFSFEIDFFLSGFQKRAPELRQSVDEFTILFDLPSVRRIDFTTNGSEGLLSYNGQAVENFIFNRFHRFSISGDFKNDSWTGFLNGEEVFTTSISTSYSSNPQMGNIRVNLNDDPSLPNQPSAYIDNLKFISFSTIPEPNFTCFFLIGSLALLQLRTRG